MNKKLRNNVGETTDSYSPPRSLLLHTNPAKLRPQTGDMRPRPNTVMAKNKIDVVFESRSPSKAAVKPTLEVGSNTLNFKVSKQKQNLMNDIAQASKTINISLTSKQRPLSSPPIRTSHHVSPAPEQQKEVPTALNIEIEGPRTPAVEPERYSIEDDDLSNKKVVKEVESS